MLLYLILSWTDGKCVKDKVTGEYLIEDHHLEYSNKYNTWARYEDYAGWRDIFKAFRWLKPSGPFRGKMPSEETVDKSKRLLLKSGLVTTFRRKTTKDTAQAPRTHFVLDILGLRAKLMAMAKAEKERLKVENAGRKSEGDLRGANDSDVSVINRQVQRLVKILQLAKEQSQSVLDEDISGEAIEKKIQLLREKEEADHKRRGYLGAFEETDSLRAAWLKRVRQELEEELRDRAERTSQPAWTEFLNEIAATPLADQILLHVAAIWCYEYREYFDEPYRLTPGDVEACQGLRGLPSTRFAKVIRAFWKMGVRADSAVEGFDPAFLAGNHSKKLRSVLNNWKRVIREVKAGYKSHR